ncbi:hypothetical protein E2C01_027427 [Portunus trituberculatus]|uniref:Uncharacterized protein n=1 Tax=Portunus trituberculatus TaxID=210409 RepID=A0A5B7EKU1_PORTR|nr:hypothetical protein [Portunus trituberculatus]
MYGILPSFLSDTALSPAARFGPVGVVSKNCSATTLKRILPPASLSVWPKSHGGMRTMWRISAS